MDGAIRGSIPLLGELAVFVGMPPHLLAGTIVLGAFVVVLFAVLTASAARKWALQTSAPGWRAVPEGMGQQIFDATVFEDMVALRPLVQEWSGHDVLNWPNPGYAAGLTALIAGSRLGKADAIRLLLATPGVDINRVDYNGWTACMHAAYNGHTEVVRALVAAPGIDLNKRATDDQHKGKNALGIAIDNGRPEAAALLKAGGAEGGEEQKDEEKDRREVEEETKKEEKEEEEEEEKKEEKKEEEKESVPAIAAREAPEGTGQQIFDAAKAGDMAALRPLVQEWSGHDVLNWANADFLGFNPLIVCSYEGEMDAVRLLMATPGVDVNKADYAGMTAVMLAALGGHTEIVRALLAAPGIDVNKTGADGATALGLAIDQSHHEAAALLRTAGAEEEKEEKTRADTRRGTRRNTRPGPRFSQNPAADKS